MSALFLILRRKGYGLQKYPNTLISSIFRGLLVILGTTVKYQKCCDRKPIWGIVFCRRPIGTAAVEQGRIKVKWISGMLKTHILQSLPESNGIECRIFYWKEMKNFMMIRQSVKKKISVRIALTHYPGSFTALTVDEY